MSFLAALQLLTIIPVRRDVGPEKLGRSIAYFPVVGIIIGLILAGLSWLLCLFLPSIIVNTLLIVFLVIISGALHLDGFIDSCDGIAVHGSVEDRWRVMHDSRAGALGIIGVFLLLLVKYVALSSVPANLLMPTLVLMPVVSRWAMAYTIFAYPYARPTGLGKAYKEGASWPRFTTATIITLAVAIGLARWVNTSYFYLAGLTIMLGIWVIVVALATYLKRKFAGLTGDSYGAVNEVAEVVVLILVAMLAHNHWLGLT